MDGVQNSLPRVLGHAFVIGLPKCHVVLEQGDCGYESEFNLCAIKILSIGCKRGSDLKKRKQFKT